MTLVGPERNASLRFSFTALPLKHMKTSKYLYRNTRGDLATRMSTLHGEGPHPHSLERAGCV